MTQMLNGAAPHAVPPAVSPEAIGVPHRVRWRRGSARPTTARRAVGLARFAVGTGLDPDLGGVDAAVRRAAAERAQHALDRAARRNRARARRCDALADRAAADREAARHLDSALLPDPVLGAARAADVRTIQARTGAAIGRQVEAGDDRHRRTDPGPRRVAAMLPWLDALLFGYFVSGVSNADLAAPWTTPVASAVAAGLTLLVVLVVAAFTPWLGRRLRRCKAATGEPDWSPLPPSSVGLLGLWAVLLVGMGVTMYVRVRTEAGYAGAEETTAVVVSVLLALAAVVLNVYVLGVSYADGTAAADDLHVRAARLARQEGRQRRLRLRADRLLRRRARIARRAAAGEATATARAACRLRHGERLVELGRLRTGMRPPSNPTGALTDRLDITPLADARRDV